MSAGYSLQRFDDVTRLEELHRFVQDAFRNLPIDPLSSALKETVADFAADDTPISRSHTQGRAAHL